MKLKTKLLNLTFLILSLVISTPVFSRTTVAFIEYTPGIDEGTNNLLPDSDWRMEIAPTFSTTCEDISPGLTFHKTVSVPVQSYINKNLTCQTATHPGFEGENGLTWVDKGFKQDPLFGNEMVTCPIYGSCEMERIVSTGNLSFGSIELQNGENGTSNGSGKIFVTKLGSITINSTPGQGGIGGRNDLDYVVPQTRYCARITDALSPNATETTSKTPYAEIDIFKWTPFSVSGGGADGINAQSTRTVEVFEGLDPTTLHWLKEYYFE